MKVETLQPIQSITANEQTSRIKSEGINADNQGDQITISKNHLGKVEKKEAAQVTFIRIKKEIARQTYIYLNAEDKNHSGIEKLNTLFQHLPYGEDGLGLHAYFSNNPEDLKAISEGMIPDYFNVENTGQRILDIWLKPFDGSENVYDFIEKVKENINQAYSEISGLFGGLPELVTSTQDYIMQELDKFAEEQKSQIDESQ